MDFFPAPRPDTAFSRPSGCLSSRPRAGPGCNPGFRCLRLVTALPGDQPSGPALPLRKYQSAAQRHGLSQRRASTPWNGAKMSVVINDDVLNPRRIADTENVATRSGDYNWAGFAADVPGEDNAPSDKIEHPIGTLCIVAALKQAEQTGKQVIVARVLTMQGRSSYGPMPSLQ